PANAPAATPGRRPSPAVAGAGAARTGSPLAAPTGARSPDRPAGTLFTIEKEPPVPRKPAQVAPPKDEHPLQPPLGRTLTRAQREEQLAIACRKVAGCTRCEELATTRTQT